MQALHKVDAVFDDPNLIASAGLVPVMRLADRAGLHELLQERLSVPSANAGVKAACVVAGMLAGADSIDDLDVLRHGGMSKVVTGVRAPSTVGTFLRTFTFGHVRQLDAVAARVVAGLAAVVPRLLAGTESMAFVDVDDTIREVHGYQKQGAAYGYSGVKGLNAQLAVLSSPMCARSSPPPGYGRELRLRARRQPSAGRRGQTARAAGVTSWSRTRCTASPGKWPRTWPSLHGGVIVERGDARQVLAKPQKRALVVGTGSIGRDVARLLRAVGRLDLEWGWQNQNPA